VLIFVAVIILLLIARQFKWSSDVDTTDAFLTMQISEWSIAYKWLSEWSKTRMKNGEKLYASNQSLLIENKDETRVQGTNEYIFLDIAKWSELSYISQSKSGWVIGLSKGRVWFQTESSLFNIQMKTFSVNAVPWNIFLLEQNTLYSTAYAIKWALTIVTKWGNFTLNAGNRIMLRDSDIAEDADIGKFAWEIDESIAQNPLFLQNNWESILKEARSIRTGSWDIVDTQSWGLDAINGSGNISAYVKITQPIDGSSVGSSKITVMGDILSKEVTRVTINDRDASVSPVNESFVLQDIELNQEVFNIVYKAYSKDNRLLEKGVISVYGSKWMDANQKLVPENFPLSNKDFQIFAPKENPYKTTETGVKVQWIVPKNTVQYIMVNDYRLQKFIPNSSTWYYFANTETETMKEGINIYSIKFYNSDNKLLYTQLFTIVKESKNATISSEVLQ
jgi:hypothetical protein